jgi:hypothetical protein
MGSSKAIRHGLPDQATSFSVADEVVDHRHAWSTESPRTTMTFEVQGGRAAPAPESDRASPRPTPPFCAYASVPDGSALTVMAG